MAAQRMGLAEQGNLYSGMLGRKCGLKPGNPATNNKNIVFWHWRSLAPDTIAEMVREGQIQPPILLAAYSYRPPGCRLGIFSRPGPATFDQSLFRDNIVHTLVVRISPGCEGRPGIHGPDQRAAPRIIRLVKPGHNSLGPARVGVRLGQNQRRESVPDQSGQHS